MVRIPTSPSTSNPSVRQPVIAPIPATHCVFGEEMLMSFELVFIALADKLGLPGFDKDAFGPGLDLNRPEDFYVRTVANLAAGEKPDYADAVPDADDREVQIFLSARRHLPKHMFDPVYWKALLGGDDRLWRKNRLCA